MQDKNDKSFLLVYKYLIRKDRKIGNGIKTSEIYLNSSIFLIYSVLRCI
jgi:hypothetical protein